MGAKADALQAKLAGVRAELRDARIAIDRLKIQHAIELEQRDARIRILEEAAEAQRDFVACLARGGVSSSL